MIFCTLSRLYHLGRLSLTTTITNHLISNLSQLMALLPPSNTSGVGESYDAPDVGSASLLLMCTEIRFSRRFEWRDSVPQLFLAFPLLGCMGMILLHAVNLISSSMNLLLTEQDKAVRKKSEVKNLLEIMVT